MKGQDDRELSHPKNRSRFLAILSRMISSQSLDIKNKATYGTTGLKENKNFTYPSVLLAGVTVLATFEDCLLLETFDVTSSPSNLSLSTKISVLLVDLPSFMALPVADDLCGRKREPPNKAPGHY